MTKSSLWSEIKETFNINSTELKNLTGKTYAESTKEDLRYFFNNLIDISNEVDEDLAVLKAKLSSEINTITSYKGIPIDHVEDNYRLYVLYSDDFITDDVEQALITKTSLTVDKIKDTKKWLDFTPEVLNDNTSETIPGTTLGKGEPITFNESTGCFECESMTPVMIPKDEWIELFEHNVLKAKVWQEITTKFGWFTIQHLKDSTGSCYDDLSYRDLIDTFYMLISVDRVEG